MKKIILILLVIILALTLTACSPREEVVEQYICDYIAQNYDGEFWVKAEQYNYNRKTEKDIYYYYVDVVYDDGHCKNYGYIVAVKFSNGQVQNMEIINIVT